MAGLCVYSAGVTPQKESASVLPTCRSAGIGHAAWECQRNSLRLELFLFAFLTAA